MKQFHALKVAAVKLAAMMWCSTIMLIWWMVPNANAVDQQKHIFVIAMENTDATSIYGNFAEAPFINNKLLPIGSHSLNFNDLLSLLVPSEPHYVLMEAGKTNFVDWTATGNGDPSALNSTSSSRHLVAQIRSAAKSTGLSWMTYQEGISLETGRCPIRSHGRYAAKHNPFVFFRDVSGSPPSKTNKYCIEHTRGFARLSSDLKQGQLANYVFITPNLCHDMHDKCGTVSAIRSADDWLRAIVPAILEFNRNNHGMLFLVWDEGRHTTKLRRHKKRIRQ
jgi:hypothetical protein